MSETLPALDAPNPHPIHLVVTDDLRRSRLTVFFRLMLVIPHLIWLTLWGIAVYFAVIVAWIVGLVAGRVPDALHRLHRRLRPLLHPRQRVLADRREPYPSFSGATGYPVDIDIAPAARQSRLTIFFRILLAIPALDRVVRPATRRVGGLAPRLVLCADHGTDERAACATCWPTASATRRRRSRTSTSSRSGTRASPTTDPVRVETVDYHTGGEPFRIVTAGVPPLEGATILERRRHARERLDNVRRLLVFEPRGHADMYGCHVVPPNDDGADLGVVFFHNEGYSTACGHGTIALVTWALEAGVVERREGETRVVVDVPSGRLETWARVEGGRVKAVRFRNVPSFVWARDLEAAGRVVDVAFGGAFYASLEERVEPRELPRLIELGRRIKAELETAHDVVHPLEPELRDVYGVVFWQAEQAEPLTQRNVTVFADGEVDRSPCGSGNVREARAARRGGKAAARRLPPAPLDRRLGVHGACRRGGGGGRAPRRRHRGRGLRIPDGSLRVRARPRRSAGGGLSPPLARGEGGDQLVLLREAALVLLGEDERAVGENVELALRAFHGSRVVALPRQHGRETRGPAVVAASDGAVEDLDAHDRTLPDRRRAARRPEQRPTSARQA